MLLMLDSLCIQRPTQQQCLTTSEISPCTQVLFVKRRTLIYYAIYLIIAIPLFLTYAASYLEPPYLDSTITPEIDSPILSSEEDPVPDK